MPARFPPRTAAPDTPHRNAPSQPVRRRLIRHLGLGGAGVLALGLLGGCGPGEGKAAAARFRGLNVTGVNYGRGFELPDAQGKVRTLGEFQGKLVMVFFGFVQCPDVCPTALARAVEVRELLGEAGTRLQVIFITVDPERDTPDILHAYATAFAPDFIALRGDAQQLRRTADEFRVFYRQAPGSSPEHYTMDHTAQSYVFDPAGRLRLVFGHNQSAQDIAHDLRLLLDEAGA